MNSCPSIKYCIAAFIAFGSLIFATDSHSQTLQETKCVAKLFNYTFCLGGSLSDFESNRTYVLMDIVPTSKESDGIENAELHMLESQEEGYSIQVNAIVYEGVLVKVTKLWKAPNYQTSEIEQRLAKEYHPISLGNPISFGKRPTDGRYDNGITSEMIWQQGGYKIKLLKGANTGVTYELSPIYWTGTRQ
ncbi:MAG: hypothetical protein NUV80_05595 [Candidatus Berkelbacteria bacterium]|nr:hypothetical protein [Candidatus Berkelbacteria bacterium]